MSRSYRAMADAMAANGMKDAGYQYINIDDCWHGERDAQGFIQADPAKFPSGIKVLADYVHSKGLKLGIYTDVGYKTCGGYIASRGHEFQDAMTYSQWGVDYLKYDWCNAENLNPVGSVHDHRATRCNHGPADHLQHFASGARTNPRSGARASAIAGAPLSISGRTSTDSWTTPIGSNGASSRSSTRKNPSANTPDPAIGTIRTCSKWATA